MLKLKLKQSNTIDPAGKKIFLVDSTNDYDSVTNTTGYGTPNPERSDIAVFPIGFLNDSKGNKSVIAFEPYSPTQDDNWTALPQGDGWLVFYLEYVLAFENPDAGDFNPGDIIYSKTDGKLVKVVVGLTGNYFQGAAIADLPMNTSSDTLEQFFIAGFSLLKIRLNERKTELLMESENLSNRKKIAIVQDAYDTVRGILQGSLYQFKIGNKYEAARQLEFLSTNNYSELFD